MNPHEIPGFELVTQVVPDVEPNTEITAVQQQKIAASFLLMADSDSWVQSEATVRANASDAAVAYGHGEGSDEHKAYVEETAAGWMMLKEMMGLNPGDDVTFADYYAFIETQIKEKSYAFFNGIAFQFFLRLVGDAKGELTPEMYERMLKADKSWSPNWMEHYDNFMQGRPATLENVMKVHLDYWFSGEMHYLMGEKVPSVEEINQRLAA